MLKKTFVAYYRYCFLVGHSDQCCYWLIPNWAIETISLIVILNRHLKYMEICRNSLFICFKTMKWRLFSSKHSLERALNSFQLNWLFQPKLSISRDSALANILRICSDKTHNSQYIQRVGFSCPNIHIIWAHFKNIGWSRFSGGWKFGLDGFETFLSSVD